MIKALKIFVCFLRNIFGLTGTLGIVEMILYLSKHSVLYINGSKIWTEFDILTFRKWYLASQ